MTQKLKFVLGRGQIRLWEKEKMLVTSIFSFSHYVFKNFFPVESLKLWIMCEHLTMAITFEWFVIQLLYFTFAFLAVPPFFLVPSSRSSVKVKYQGFFFFSIGGIRSQIYLFSKNELFQLKKKPRIFLF